LCLVWLAVLTILQKAENLKGVYVCMCVCVYVRVRERERERERERILKKEVLELLMRERVDPSVCMSKSK
jgi:hypothetical protein